MAAKKTTTKKTAARGKTARRPPEPEQALSRAAWGAIWGIAGLLCLLAILPIDGALLDWLHSGVGALVGRGGYVLPFALFALAGLLFVREKGPVRLRGTCIVLLPVFIGGIIHALTCANEYDFSMKTLFALQDLKYRDFQRKLMPTVDPETVIGVRTPELRKLARSYGRQPESREFLKCLPHQYYEENNLHAFLLETIRDYGRAVEEVERFLPYVDNWATCDSMSPPVFKREKARLLPAIRRWLASDQTYTVRYGIGMLMQHFLDEDFCPEYPALVAAVQSEEYYIQMMIAWYFATALAKQPEAVWPYLTEERLSPWVHNKTIQKACESRRITPGQKAALRALRRPGRGDTAR